MPDDPTVAMDALLDRLVGVLSGTGGASSPSTGSDASGLVSATLAASGRVDAVTLDPLLARSPERIAAGIAEAVNAAVDARPLATSAATRADELAAIKQDTLELSIHLNGSLLAAVERLKAT